MTAAPPDMTGKTRAVLLLLIAETAAMALWFVSAAVLPEMTREAALSPGAQAALSSAVQAGFVAGALGFAILGVADRCDPRHVFAASAALAGALNALLIFVPVGGAEAIGLRFLTGVLLAGVYPVGMKIMVGWGTADRGFLIGALVGALTLGSAAPHLIAFLGGAEWRITVAVASAAAIGAGLLGFAIRLGPHHGRAARFDPKVVLTAWTNRRVRYAYGGYLGHMWELYAFWAWIGAAAAASFAATLPADDATEAAKLTAFLAVGIGAPACVLAGRFADRIGKAEVTILAMAGSGAAALATALTFGGPAWLTILCVAVWGLTVIPDSAQFSAAVADAVPAEHAGSLLTFQTALGFALTIVTVQATPALAAAWGWPTVLALMALGPALGILSMLRLRRLR